MMIMISNTERNPFFSSIMIILILQEGHCLLVNYREARERVQTLFFFLHAILYIIYDKVSS